MKKIKSLEYNDLLKMTFNDFLKERLSASEFSEKYKAVSGKKSLLPSTDLKKLHEQKTKQPELVFDYLRLIALSKGILEEKGKETEQDILNKICQFVEQKNTINGKCPFTNPKQTDTTHTENKTATGFSQLFGATSPLYLEENPAKSPLGNPRTTFTYYNSYRAFGTEGDEAWRHSVLIFLRITTAARIENISEELNIHAQK